jgi:hypothetical protein
MQNRSSLAVRLAAPIVAIFIALITGYVVAQEIAPEVPHDPRLWFLSTGALAGVVVAFTAFIKARLDLHGIWTLVASFGTGVGLAVLGTLDFPWFGRMMPADAGFIDAVVFGATAAAFASGGWDAVKGIVIAAASGALGKR